MGAVHNNGWRIWTKAYMMVASHVVSIHHVYFSVSTKLDIYQGQGAFWKSVAMHWWLLRIIIFGSLALFWLVCASWIILTGFLVGGCPESTFCYPFLVRNNIAYLVISIFSCDLCIQISIPREISWSMLSGL